MPVSLERNTEYMRKLLPFFLLLLIFLCSCAMEDNNQGQNGTWKKLVLTKNVDDNLEGRRTEADKRTKANQEKELIIGVSGTGEVINPFYCDNDNEFYINSFINLPLLSINEKSIPVAGKDKDSLAYGYEIIENEDGSATYEFIIKSGIKTADGKDIGADDLIFTLYYCLDPQYDGYITLRNRDIRGLDEYVYQLSGGETKESVLLQIQESARLRLDKVVNQSADADDEAKRIVYGFIREAIKSDYETMLSLINNSGYSYSELGIRGYPENMPVELAIAAYIGALGFEDGKYIFAVESGLDSEEYGEYSADEIIDGCVEYVKSTMTPAGFDLHYGWNCVTDNGSGNLSFDELCRLENKKRDNKIESISGIEKELKKCDDGKVRESVKITFDSVNSGVLWDFVLFVVPMNAFYEIVPSESLNKYGVIYNSDEYMNKTSSYQLTSGAGAYTLKEHDSDYVILEANDNFLLGSPNVKNIRLMKTDYSKSMDQIMNGELHFSKTEAAPDKVNLIKNDSKYSGIGYITVNYMGYGYVGINASLIDNYDERKAIMSTMETSLSVLSYGSELCDPIYRPSTLSSWSYPVGAEKYYEYDESGEKAKNYLLSAGYKYVDGKMLDKNGEQLTYVYTLGSDAISHPLGKTFTKSHEIMSKIGVNVKIETDRYLTNTLMDGNTAVWAAAWTSKANADIFELYCSDSRLNESLLPNIYGLFDLIKKGNEDEKALCIEINEGLYSIRSTGDILKKTEIYAKLYDNIMELAVELPAYQRKDMYVYDRSVIDESTLLTGEKTGYFRTPESEIWNISLLGN